MKFFSNRVANAALFLLTSSAVFAQHYTQTNLQASTSGVAEQTDNQLVNSWGLARASGGVWWVADEATGLATLYNGPGDKQSLDRKSTRLNSSHRIASRMPSSA